MSIPGVLLDSAAGPPSYSHNSSRQPFAQTARSIGSGIGPISASVAVLAVLALFTTQARATDLAEISIKVETDRHGDLVESLAIVTNGGPSKIERLVITCAILDDQHRPLKLGNGFFRDGYFADDIQSGATAYTKLLFFIPSATRLAGISCRPIEIYPLMSTLPSMLDADAG